jgi:hypothetical protein
MKFMHKIFGIYFITLSLVGCAINTPADFRNSDPILSLRSINEAEKVAMCIADGWETIMNGFYMITFVYDGLVYYMADIVNEKNGASVSTTKYWTGTFTLQSSIDKFGNVVKDCQN